MKIVNGIELIPGVTKVFSCNFVNADISYVISCLIIAENEEEALNKATYINSSDDNINDEFEFVKISLHHTGFYTEDEEDDPFDYMCAEGYVLFDPESVR